MQRKSIPAAKQIDSELELVPYISALDRTDHFQQGILGVVLGIFPGEEVRKYSILLIHNCYTW